MLTIEHQKLAVDYAILHLESEIEKVEARRNTMYGEARKVFNSRLEELYKELEVFQNAIV